MAKLVPVPVNCIRKLEKGQIPVTRVHKMFLDKALGTNLKVELKPTEKSEIIENNMEDDVFVDEYESVFSAQKVVNGGRIITTVVRKLDMYLDDYPSLVNEAKALENELERIRREELYPDNCKVYDVFSRFQPAKYAKKF